MSPATAIAIARAREADTTDGGTSVAVVDARRISPELVLVSPDLRQAALSQLPERDADGWIPRPYSAPALRVGSSAEETPVLAGPRDGLGELVMLPSSPTGRALVLAVASYVGQSVVGAAIAGAALVGTTVALAGLADVLHP